ncbi:MAG: bifunctional hydroxymethylpyrimidine kinase/phosphomethylpyrimidine kinase [Alicyclobacillus herbarius]|uniref:bifunctional hydroxymethylpyrimidine kinase/phosphomethylpyrimidine kinase n=1 Tax=Alicyclobacillus herbarius TaxID=122960 RepID=UPI0003FF41DC|nr:bifunctional hydroxymethylpyrimidine kinase/phosphomethylpyrimidine kinase [Alicyclobacillus herbarius]MCL6631131.1 bifunctional hydroxymethylpyrimidine kinase/phosphomethylpyrimidine kinase [Alicyclobacillus herbarius]
MRKTATGHVVRALTIAGSDSGGGAGIQADLKTFAAYGVFGMSAITAVTAQNTLGVQAVEYLDEGVVRAQIRSVLEDLGTDAIKLGMLGSVQIMGTVAAELTKVSVPIVLDPVMVAKGGARLMDEDAVATLVDKLLPLAALVTPNLPEAEVLYGREIRTWQNALDVCAELVGKGAKAVILKGGHAADALWMDSPWPQLTQQMAADVLYDGTHYTILACERTETEKTHGTGCTFSSAAAAAMALGANVTDAVASAKVFIDRAIRRAQDWDVGHGHGPTDHSAPVQGFRGLEPGYVYVWQDDRWQAIGET